MSDLQVLYTDPDFEDLSSGDEFAPLDQVIYIVRPCLIGKRSFSEGDYGTVLCCETPEEAERQADKGVAFLFADIESWLEESRQLFDEGEYDPEIDEFINQFLRPPLDVRSPEWEAEKQRVFTAEELADGFYPPMTRYPHEDSTDETPAG